MKDFIFFLAYIATATEHRVTRWLLMLSGLVTGWTFAAVMHGLRVPGF